MSIQGRIHDEGLNMCVDALMRVWLVRIVFTSFPLIDSQFLGRKHIDPIAFRVITLSPDGVDVFCPLMIRISKALFLSRSGDLASLGLSPPYCTSLEYHYGAGKWV